MKTDVVCKGWRLNTLIPRMTDKMVKYMQQKKKGRKYTKKCEHEVRFVVCEQTHLSMLHRGTEVCRRRSDKPRCALLEVSEDKEACWQM